MVRRQKYCRAPNAPAPSICRGTTVALDTRQSIAGRRVGGDFAPVLQQVEQVTKDKAVTPTLFPAPGSW